MSQVAVINRSSTDDAIVAFMVEACDVQMRRDFALAWQGFEPVPLRFYAKTEELPTGNNAVVICTLEDALDEPGVLGYHTDIAGVQFMRVGARGWDTSTTISHEFLETEGDPTAAAYVKLPKGLLGPWTHIAAENCDPCQGDTYRIEVELFGRRESVQVSDFVLPSYFDPNGKRPFTFLDTIDEPFGLSRNGGGYRSLLNANTGQTTQNVAGLHTQDRVALASIERKLANPASRLSRRAVPAPHFSPVRLSARVAAAKEKTA